MGFEETFADVLSIFPRTPKNRSIKTMVVANQRGGVGKTTTAVNLATSMARLGNRVLLVDLDPQASASLWLGAVNLNHVDFSEIMTGSLYAALVNGEPPEILELFSEEKLAGSLALLPGSETLATAEYEVAGLSGQYELLYHHILEPLRSHFDYILIDTPPSLSLLTINALFGADALLLPTTCTALSMRGARQLCTTIAHLDELRQRSQRPPLCLAGVIVNNRFRSSVQGHLSNLALDIFGDFILKPFIPRRTIVEESEARQEVVSMTNHPLATNFENLSRGLLERIG